LSRWRCAPDQRRGHAALEAIQRRRVLHADSADVPVNRLGRADFYPYPVSVLANRAYEGSPATRGDLLRVPEPEGTQRRGCIGGEDDTCHDERPNLRAAPGFIDPKNCAGLVHRVDFDPRGSACQESGE
jgi:hypothetical protein